MADKEPINKKSDPARPGNDDPVLQGVDRVPPSEELESHIASETQESPEDTHTKTNIHLGGRDDEGIGTGPPEDETEVPDQNLQPLDFSRGDNPLSDEGADDDPVNLYSPPGIATPEDPEFQSSGRAQPQVKIGDQDNNRPTTEPLSGVASPQALETEVPGDGVGEDGLPALGLVVSANNPPTSADNEAVIDEDTSLTFSLTDFAFSDIDDDAFDHITITSLPENGTLEFDGSPVSEGDEIPSSALDQLVFIPDPDENGEDYATFNFTVNDGTDDSGEYTFSIDVTPVNDPPTSADDEAVIDEDTSYNFGIGDFAFSDIDGDELDHITITSLPLNGELTYDGSPVTEGDEILPENFDLLVFIPDENEHGDDYATFNFTVNDGTVDSGEYTFSIDVTSVNDLPIAEDDENEGPEDTQQVGNVLDNDSDIDGVIEVKDPGVYDTDHGSISINADGSYVYTPDANYNGDDSFEYTIIDDEGGEATATLNLTVTPVGDPPTSADNEKSTPEDTPYGFSIADFVFNDVDGDSLDHITITELPASGELTLYGNPVSPGDDIAPGDISNLLYTPPENASGDNLGDFKFTVNDGNEDSVEYDFSIDVIPVADTPDLCLLGEIPETSGLYDISAGGIVTIDATYYSAIADNALFLNSHGYYVADSDGNPIGGAIIQDNAKQGGNFDITFNTDDYPGGVTLGFFLVPDGDQQNSELSDGDPVTFEQVDGVWVPFIDGVPVSGRPFLPEHFSEEESLPAFFSNPDLNADNYDHLQNNIILGNQNWEDIVNGGDHDYSDLNALIRVTLETCEDIDTQGLEGTLIPVPEIMAALNDTDGSETLTLVISNIPEGVKFSDDLGNEFTATGLDNDVDVTDWNLSALNVFSPIGQDDFTVQVTATATENENGDEASSTRNINVDILHAPETEIVDLGATLEDTPIVFTTADLLSSASDADGDDLFISNVAIDPAYGTILDNGDDTYTFTPTENYSGDDLPITYDIFDGLATTAGNAIIDVTAVADTPNLKLIGEIPETSGLYDISEGGTVTIDATYYSAIADTALFNNSHGYYVADSDGNPIGGAIIQDNSKEGGNFDITFNTEDYPGGVTLGFFLVPDGDTQNADLEDGDAVTFEFVDGVWVPSVDGVPIEGRPYLPEHFTEEESLPAFFSNPDLNADNYDHLNDNEIAGNQNWEDIVNGGDHDYSDLNALIKVTLETEGDIDIQGDEGTTIPVPEVLASLNDTDGSETLSVLISGIPEGVMFSDDGGNEFTATDVDNEVDVSGWNLSELSVFSPIGQDDFTVQVTSKATETSNSDEASKTSNINVDIILAPEELPDGPEENVLPLVFEANASPLAEDDNSLGAENIQQTGNVLDNDEDSDGTISVKDPGVFATENGTITINADGSYLYVPNTDFSGSDKYEYTIVDDDGAEAIATLHLIIDNDISEIPGSDKNDQLYGDEERNYIDGKGGNDKLYGGGEADILIGGDGNDTINGEEGDDQIFGGSGNDAIFGEDGDDIIYGGSGQDTIHAGDGDDIIYGGDDKDTIHGGEGDDVIIAGSGNDKLHGNEGSDVFVVAAMEGDDHIQAGTGEHWTDVIELTGFDGLDHEVGWTLVLDSGSVQSTDDENGEMVLSQDSDGKITFDDGGSITFENVEKIVW